MYNIGTIKNRRTTQNRRKLAESRRKPQKGAERRFSQKFSRFHELKNENRLFHVVKTKTLSHGKERNPDG